MKGFNIRTNIDDMDFDTVYQFLSQSYWAQGIPRTTLRKVMMNSFCFGVFDEQEKQSWACAANYGQSDVC